MRTIPSLFSCRFHFHPLIPLHADTKFLSSQQRSHWRSPNSARISVNCAKGKKKRLRDRILKAMCASRWPAKRKPKRQRCAKIKTLRPQTFPDVSAHESISYSLKKGTIAQNMHHLISQQLDFRPSTLSWRSKATEISLARPVYKVWSMRPVDVHVRNLGDALTC